MKTIFLVDDEEDIRKLVSIQLKKNGFDHKTFEDGISLFQTLEHQTPDLILLDLMLPDIDGLEICKKIKNSEKTKHIPIIMLTAKGDEMDRIIGLELGADDYVPKPFSPRELIARIKAVLRRVTPQARTTDFIELANGNIRIDPDKYELCVDNEKVEVTTTEFKVILLLSQRKGWVYSRQQILDYLWGKDKIVLDRTVDVHIKNLRDKLSNYSHIIKNVRSVGYKIEE